jgi:uncharacterized protein YaaW (UPF0174 family)
MLDRREFLAASAGCLSLGVCGAKTSRDDGEKELAKAAPFIKRDQKWGADHLYEFLNALPDKQMLSLKKAIGLAKEKAGLEALKGKSRDVRDVQKRALWLSSNIMAYPFRKAAAMDYHRVVSWVAKKAGVEKEYLTRDSTFELERQVQEKLFQRLWDKLTVKQRMELLDKIDPKGALKDKAAIAAMSGAGAIAALSATVYFTGFAFYVTMSITISTVAGFFGLTLPFAAYTGASSLVAFLSGPIGWAIMGLAALAGVSLAGRANVKKTTAFICQIHSLKIAAALAAGIPEHKLFPAPERAKR